MRRRTRSPWSLPRIAGPGVPDTYQGSELWNLALVDPDNRAEVDFAARRAALREIREGTRDKLRLIRRLLERYEDGALKLYVTHTLLAPPARNPRPSPFEGPIAPPRWR